MEPVEPHTTAKTDAGKMERITIQAKPTFISNIELHRATVGREKIAFSYTDLLDNLTQAEKDITFVTGRSNTKELVERISQLKELIHDHESYKKIWRELYSNYDAGMSFNKEQSDFIRYFATRGNSGKGSHYPKEKDYEEYLLAKEYVAKYYDQPISQEGETGETYRHLRNMTLGELFKTLFPQKSKTP